MLIIRNLNTMFHPGHICLRFRKFPVMNGTTFSRFPEKRRTLCGFRPKFFEIS